MDPWVVLKKQYLDERYLGRTHNAVANGGYATTSSSTTYATTSSTTSSSQFTGRATAGQHPYGVQSMAPSNVYGAGATNSNSNGNGVGDVKPVITQPPQAPSHPYGVPLGRTYAATSAATSATTSATTSSSSAAHPYGRSQLSAHPYASASTIGSATSGVSPYMSSAYAGADVASNAAGAGATKAAAGASSSSGSSSADSLNGSGWYNQSASRAVNQVLSIR
jgi:hypothetical protein